MSDNLRVPFVPSSWERLETMIEISGVQEGNKTLDLGSGDGRVVIAMAKKGALAYGYDINQDLIREARKNIDKENLSSHAFIYEKDYWDEDLSSFDIITLYGMTSIMENLEKKLINELLQGAKVVSNLFTFPNWKPIHIKGQVYVYIK